MTNSSKPKDFQFIIIYDKGNHQILTFKELKLANVWHFWLKKTETISQLVAD